MSEQLLCGATMSDNDDLVSSMVGPCLLDPNHDGDHLSQDTDMVIYVWRDDYDCGCDPEADDYCRGSDDFTDSCFTWDKVTFEEAKRLIKEQT